MNKIMPNPSKTFICEQCDYSCKSEQIYSKHLMTRKHLNGPLELTCQCGKIYKTNQGLTGHMKKCKEIQNVGAAAVANEVISSEELKKRAKLSLENITNSYEAMRQDNAAFKKQLLELVKTSEEEKRSKEEEEEEEEEKEEASASAEAGENNTTTTMVEGKNEVYNIRVYLNEKFTNPRKLAIYIKYLLTQMDDLESDCELEINFSPSDDEEEEKAREGKEAGGASEAEVVGGGDKQ